MITFFTTLEQLLYREKNSLLSWSKLDCVNKIVVYTSLDSNVFSDNPKIITEKYPNDLDPLDPPSIRDIFMDAIAKTEDKYLCYINSDIILLSDFCKTFAQVQHQYQTKPFQIVGKRRDWVDHFDIDVNNLSDEQIIATVGYLPIRNAEHCDYFLFDRKIYTDLNDQGFFPNFLIARGSFDRCMLWLPRQLGYDSIDCSESIYAIHHEEIGSRKEYINNRPKLWNQVKHNERLLYQAMSKFKQNIYVISGYPGVNAKWLPKD